MDKIKQQQNRGYLIAGVGALVALLAFLLLPYVIITVSSAAGGASEYVAITLNATALTQSSTNGTNSIFNSSQIQNQGFLWLLPILALAALAVTGLLVFRDHPFGKGMNAPLEKQRRWGNYGLIGAAALSVLIQIVLFSNLNGQIQNAVNASGSGSNTTTTVSTGTHVGFWLFLLGMLAVAAGAIFLLVQENKQMQAAQAVPNMPGGQSYQPPLDPYSQQYPPQQAQPYPPQQAQPYASQQPQQAQPYPPQQAQPYASQQPQPYPPQQAQPYAPQQPQQAQPYPPQQWPSSNPPQSPYPPGQ